MQTEIIENVILYRDFLSDPPTVMDIFNHVEFDSAEETKVRICGRWVNIPRRQTSYGDEGTFYRFSGKTSHPKEWTPFMTNLRRQIEEKLGTTFNFVLVNWYQNGDHYIGWHSDDEKDLKLNHIIASYTIGEEREFLLRNKRTKEVTKIPLPSNSLLIMGGDTQKNYTHSVPKRKNCKNPRVNFTWRQMRVK